MSDQDPIPPIDGTGPTDGSLAPPPAQSAPRRSRTKMVLTSVAVVLAVVAGGFALVSLTESDGAASAEDAVQGLFDAVDDQDAIGVAESLEPSERRILLDALEEAETQARRVDVTDDGLDLRAVDGVDLAVENLRLQAQPLDDETVAVDVVAGHISSRTQLSKMPIGPVVQEVIDRNEEAGEGVDDATEDEIELAGTRIVAVKRGGGWYVSAFYSLAEEIRLGDEVPHAYPTASTAIPAVGADSPEAAVREGVAAAVKADVRRLIELTPAEEARVLHTYGPILVDEAKGSETGATVEDLDLKVSDAPGGRKKVSATSMKLTIDTRWDRQVTTYDGTCSTTTWEYTDPEEYGYEEGETGDTWTQCDDDMSTSLSPFGLFNVFYAPGGLDVIVEEHDGKWFLSPTGTLVQNTVGVLEGLDRDEVRRIARAWGGEWWLYEPSEVWEACGVAEPSLDDSRAEAEDAYDQCMESLPDDYDGPWGPFGGRGMSSFDDYDPMPGDECYETTTNGDAMSMDAIEACLEGLVAAGTLDPTELAAFRCGRIFSELDQEGGLSDEEYEARWDEADDRYETCMDAAGAGQPENGSGSVTFGTGGTTATTTAPAPSTPSTTRPSTTATTRPPAVTTTTRPPAPVTTTTAP
jgi:hypothetical protein